MTFGLLARPYILRRMGVQQVEPLRKLLEARSKLSDLRNKLAGNDKLEDVLGEVLNNTEKLKQLGEETQQGGE